MQEITEEMGVAERVEVRITQARELLAGGTDARGECETCHTRPVELYTWPGIEEWQECGACVTQHLLVARRRLDRWAAR